eukprot:6368101-Amphidinium_carterae.1
MKAGKLAGSEYTTMFEPVPEDIAAVMAEADRVPSISFQELQEKYNIEFDTLLVDCEGCFENMLAEFPNMLDQVSTLMLEADYGMEWQPGGYANYSRVLATLKSLGFLQKPSALSLGCGHTSSQAGNPCCNLSSKHTFWFLGGGNRVPSLIAVASQSQPETIGVAECGIIYLGDRLAILAML